MESRSDVASRSPTSGRGSTFGNDPQVVETINGILLDSWPAYENYTGPLGAQTLTDIIGAHYGPGVESSERNGWGQWHRADDEGHRHGSHVATGTGYIGQYSPPVAAMYESLAACPDELLLFMHHVPYTHVLHSGEDRHPAHLRHALPGRGRGRPASCAMAALQGIVDERALRRGARAARVPGRPRDRLARCHRQLVPEDVGHRGREGTRRTFPGRYEAEAMTLTATAPIDVTPWETASGGKAVVCGAATCAASFDTRDRRDPSDIAIQ